MAYSNLKDFINEKYYDLIYTKIKGYVFSHKDYLNLSSNYIPYPFETDIYEVEITSLHTEALANDYVYIHCNGYADIVFKGHEYGNRHNDVEEDSKRVWLGIKIRAKFVDAFEEVKIVEVCHIDEKDSYKVKGSSTKSFIPYIREADLDSYASDFLSKYYPEALKKPMALPVNEVVKAMGLHAKKGNLEDGVFGKCYFIDKKVKNKEGKEVVIPKGTIVCDDNSVFFNGIGSLNNTVIHECVHWEFHRKYFSLMHLLDPSLSAITCAAIDTDNTSKTNNEDYFWMEWQANALTPRILMPIEMMKLKYEQVKAEIVNCGETNLQTIYKKTVNQLANFFNVTITSVKIRLIELGYDCFKGINEYADNKPIKAYLFDNSKINSNQTFSAGLFDSTFNSIVNKDLRTCLEAKTIVYANGFFVINNKKYTYKDPLTRKQELTDYALSHMDECCLVYDNEPKDKKSFDDRYYSMCYLCKTQGSQNAYQKTIRSNEHNDGILRKSIDIADVIEENVEAIELAKKLNGSFAENLSILMTEYGYSNRELKNQSNIDDHKIAAFLDGSKEPNKNEVLAIIAAMQLYPVVALHFLEVSGFKLSNASEKDCIYNFFINNCYEEGLESWNEKLRDADKIDWQLP